MYKPTHKEKLHQQKNMKTDNQIWRWGWKI